MPLSIGTMTALAQASTYLSQDKEGAQAIGASAQQFKQAADKDASTGIKSEFANSFNQ